MIETIASFGAMLGKVPQLASEYMKVQQEAMKLLDLMDALKTENQSLRDKIRDMEQREKIQGTLRFASDRIYAKDEAGSESGPYCMDCWYKNGRLVLLRSGRVEIARNVQHLRAVCPVCKADFPLKLDPGVSPS